MDRLTEMEAFATVVDQGGFTDAARRLGLSKSAVSKHVSSLESRLGARLLNRTTRRVSPTEVGLVYYDRARRVLTDAGEADAAVSALQSAPSGLLRVSAPTCFGAAHVAPALGGFLGAHPEVSVGLALADRLVEIVSEGFDLAVRVGEMEDSSLLVRKLATCHRQLVAAPDYLRRHGHPERIDDLPRHALLHFAAQAGGAVWRITAPSGERRQIRAQGRITVNDGRSLLAACEAGLGIAFLPSYLYGEAMRAGRVAPAIPGLAPETLSVSAVYPPGPHTQPKVRAFIDFLAHRFRGRGAEEW
jgi:DNA-binding transcriptional LysR family regulator